MSTGNWQNLSFHVQGEVSYALRIDSVDASKAVFQLEVFSEKWDNADMEFLYRFDDRELWSHDAIISEASSEYLQGNRMYGLTTGLYGTNHYFTWQFGENGVEKGHTVEIKIDLLPRVRQFGNAGSITSVVEMYGDAKIVLKGMSSDRCFAVDQDGNYMCGNSASFYLIDELGIGGDE